MDAAAILSTSIPQCDVKDRVAWTGTSNGIYSAKSCYHFWFDRMVGVGNVLQHQGWGKVWSLNMPHKVKIFIWCFCRNNVPVRTRLNSKGINLPLVCPVCNHDSEHLLHLFFECEFVVECWNHVNFYYDLSDVFDVSEWLLDKLNEASADELVSCVRFFGGYGSGGIEKCGVIKL